MSRNRKLERALYGPSLFEITLGVILSLLLGLVIGSAALVFKPVMVVKEKEMPAEEDRDPKVVYYVEGSRDYIKGKQWMRKRQLIADGTPGEIIFTEDELNSWAASLVPKDRLSLPPPKPKGENKEGSKPSAAPAEEINMSGELAAYYAANFRIRDNVMQAALPAMVTLPFTSIRLPVIVQTRGDFLKVGDLYMYHPSEFYVGSLPLHRFIDFNEQVMQSTVERQNIPEEVMEIWRKISDVGLDGRTLRLTIQEPAPAGI